MVERGSAAPERAILGVSELVRSVGELLATRFSACTVRGEISGLSRAPSGHCYFSLRDADGGGALVRCAMFRRSASLLAFAPTDGQLVDVRGRLGVYEPRGELQLVVEGMQQAGAGALYEQFLQIKARLQAQGLFDPSRKRPLPPYPRAVGVVTSLGAAALQDVLTALARRAPHVRVVVYPSLVQGAEAPTELVKAFALASVRAEVDVLIVCRGGGSLEDLWAFNEERVVRAIVAAPMPVLCGVGHETDVTLSDFAADLRAPTPTAAAELASPTQRSCLEALDLIGQVMQRRVRAALDSHAQRLDRTAFRLARPGQGVREQAQRVALLAHRLASQLPLAAQMRRTQLAQLESALGQAAVTGLARQDQRLDALAARLRALDPKQVLSRGYAWLSDETGRAVVSVDRLVVGAALQAVLSDGEADVQVVGVQRRANN